MQALKDRSTRRRSMRIPTSLALALVAGLPLFAASAGCLKIPGLFTAKEEAKPTPAPTPTGPKLPNIDYAAVRPNEMGRIPVVMYHEIGGKPAPKDPSLVRTVEGFKKDLELMYAAGFRPVNMADVVNNRIDVEAGKSPIVITFDDARESQFRLIETDKALKIDPTSGVGIMKEFHDKHPDWALKATFFVLPKSKRTMDSFGQPGLGTQKLSWLVEQGMELANHTTLHRSLARMTPAELQQEIGNAHNSIMAAVPNAKIECLAVPMGIFPRDKKNWQYLLKGTYQGHSYDYKVAMLAAYRPIPSPAAKAWDPFRLERIAPNDGDPNGLRNWLVKLSGATGNRYVSDGDPNVISIPKGIESEVNTKKLESEGKLVHAYSPFGTGGGAKPIVMDGEPAADTPAAGTAGAAGAPAAPTSEVSVTQKPISGG